MTIRMAVIAAIVCVSATPALAQNVPTITIRPLENQSIGTPNRTGPYPSLPGVDFWRGRTAPGAQATQVRLPQRTIVPGEYTRVNPPLPVLDGWHGSVSEGIPF